MVDGTRVPPKEPLRKLIRAHDRSSKLRELVRMMKRGNNPDANPMPQTQTGVGVDDKTNMRVV